MTTIDGDAVVRRIATVNHQSAMNKTPASRSQTATLFGALMIALPLLLLALTAHAGQQSMMSAPFAGIDLTADLSYSDPTLTVVFKNLGDTASGNTSVRGYCDPPVAPQIGQPPPAANLNLGVSSIPAIPANSTGTQLQRNLASTVCGSSGSHTVYLWIDPANDTNPANNVLKFDLCIAPGCVPTPPPKCTVDGYENDYANPPSYAFANWIAEESTQDHTFCNQDTETVEDIDVVKFTVFSGLTYTLSVGDLGVDAKPQLAIYDGFGGTKLEESTLNGTNVSFVPAFNGFVFAQIENSKANPGIDTGYKLTLTTGSTLSDAYEPDDSCSAARDISTDGTRQDHLFQKVGDEDWIKFSLKAGDSYSIITDQAGLNVSPKVDVFAACNQVQSNNTLSSGSLQASGATNTDQTFYARISNQGGNFGAAATYRVSVIASACAPDDLEEDDSSAQAKSLSTNGTKQTHNFCPAQDQDWVKVNLQAGKTYVLLTSELAFASDTVMALFKSDGATQIAENDDYGYTSASRIVFKPTASGDYFISVAHANPIANGPNTIYKLSVQEGVCQPDALEGSNGNNGPGDAPTVPANGTPQPSNFCSDPLNLGLGDQDWISFNGVVGGNYQILTSGLGPNSDTVLQLFAGDGETQLNENDDIGEGLSARINFTPTVAGRYFVRVKQYNSNVSGSDTDYNLQLFATEPPTPTPTPTNTPTATPSPTSSPTPKPSSAETLILVNRARVEALFGAAKATALMNKLFDLADDSQVKGVVLQVESDPSVAAAYAAWTVNTTTLADNDKANNVIAAVRNRLLNFLGNAPVVKQVIIVGDDRVIPFRRVKDQVKPKGPSADSIEEKYALDLNNSNDNLTVRSALAANMVLTDDYLVDKEPSQWQDKQKNSYELYLPDYATGRLIETPDEIIAFINNFLNGDTAININPGNGKSLVTGYDFVQDGADIIKVLLSNDSVSVNGTLIGPAWPGDSLRSLYLPANPRFDLYSINGHSSHIAQGVPDGKDLTAGEVTTATTDLSGALVFSLGCHGGLNDPAVLDLPQAYARKLANYVGNTGFGWGGGGIVYSEAVYRNFVREILRDTQSNIGPALTAAKKKYYTQAMVFNAFDAKVLMQTTLYGLPMVNVNSGSTLSEDNPFPSVDDAFTPPNFSDGLSEGALGYSLPASFGAFGDSSGNQGQSFNLDGNVTSAAGEPIQPQYFIQPTPSASGELRGIVFLGGVYSETTAFDPVISLAENEYVTDVSEPAFTSSDFYPAQPFTIRSADGLGESVIMTLGQYKSDTSVNGAALTNSGVNRIYDQMSFGTYYSNSPDRNAANIVFVDGIIETGNEGQIKVESADESGVNRVIIAYDTGNGNWRSKNLSFDATTQKWTGTISATVGTKFFVQVVDNAGNVAINDNKGRYYTLIEPLPLAAGSPITRRVYLPLVTR